MTGNPSGTQEIRASDPNAEVRYTWPETISTDHDISADSFKISLGSYGESGAPVDPVEIAGPNTQRTGTLLVSVSTPPGYYYLWLHLGDAPASVTQRGHRVRVI